MSQSNDLINDIKSALRIAQDQARNSGLYLNPVLALSLNIATRIGKGEFSLDVMEEAVDTLNLESLKGRQATFQQKIGELDIQKNRETLFKLLSDKASSSDFDSFKTFLEHVSYGVVFTAHPTFTLTENVYDHLAGQDIQLDELPVPQGITLDEEFNKVQSAISAARQAIIEVFSVAFDVVAQHFPGREKEITLNTLNLANWVGFDLDGRSDISWQSSFVKRLQLSAEQHDFYLTYINEYLSECHELKSICEARKDLYLKDIAFFETAFGAEEIQSYFEGRPENLQYLITDAVSVRLSAGPDKQEKEEIKHLLILRSLLKTFGQSSAKIHVRLNSSQLHNAIRGLIGMEREPDESSVRRNYLQRLNEKLDQVQPHDTTFMHLDNEPTTARRLFMMIALFKKYISQSDRVRFLIAETDTSFTLLSALYFARFFGVEENVEISPLFETDVALHRGDKVIGTLVSNEHYRAYVESLGRLCIQVGYSDAGRFVGQIPASMAIERLKIKMLNRLAKENLTDIDVLFFDTHGESIGRGGGQADLKDRIAYFTPDYVRNLACHHGFRIIQESSFQGGDGFLFFHNKEFALGSLTRLLEDLWKPETQETDSFYEDEDSTLEFFLNLKAFNSELVGNPAYAKLLGSFAQNFLYSTGSRAVKRQHEGKADRQLDHPSQLRAIPHNAILQQLGYLANSLGGVGCSFKKNMDQLIDMYHSSKRFKQLYSIARSAESLSDTQITDAYISVLDPMVWLHRASIEKDKEERRKMRRIVRHLEEGSLSDALRSIQRLLMRDNLDFKRCENKLTAKTATDKDALYLLHSLRIGLMFQCLVWSISVPRFSNRPNISMEEVYDALFHFDIQSALVTLKEAFPRKSEETQWAIAEENISYEELYTQVFSNLEIAERLLKKITIGIANNCSGVG